MRHRRIGSTDLVASEVGLPVWSLVAGEGARSDEEAAGLLGAALDLGIAYFEATDSDDDGRAEVLLGQAVRGHRDEVTVATTFGYDTTPRPWEPVPTGPRHDWSAAYAGRAPGPATSGPTASPTSLATRSVAPMRRERIR